MRKPVVVTGTSYGHCLNSEERVALSYEDFCEHNLQTLRGGGGNVGFGVYCPPEGCRLVSNNKPTTSNPFANSSLVLSRSQKNQISVVHAAKTPVITPVITRDLEDLSLTEVTDIYKRNLESAIFKMPSPIPTKPNKTKSLNYISSRKAPGCPLIFFNISDPLHPYVSFCANIAYYEDYPKDYSTFEKRLAYLNSVIIDGG